MSIAITPSTYSAPIGSTVQFRARATYDDGTSDDITTTAIWAADHGTHIVTGLATISYLGGATITATEPAAPPPGGDPPPGTVF